MTAAPLLIEDSGPARHIWLNRPDSRNALSLDVLCALEGALGEIGTDVRAVVLGGKGPVFSSGHDLREMTDRTEREYRDIFETCSRVMERIHALDVPVIARVHGVATAAGCQLVAACDLAIAAEEARFATPGVTIGLFCSTPMVEVSRSIGSKRAMQMLLTGEMIDAATALDWGLVNRVVPASALDTTIDAMVAHIARFSRKVIAEGKQAFYRQLDAGRSDAYREMTSLMVRQALADDAQSGIKAFFDTKRTRSSDAPPHSGSSSAKTG